MYNFSCIEWVKEEKEDERRKDDSFLCNNSANAINNRTILLLTEHTVGIVKILGSQA